MGKAKIVSHIADSEYNIIYYHDMTVIDLKITKTNADIVKVNSDIAALEINITDKKAEVISLSSGLDDLILLLNACLDSSGNDIAVCEAEREAVKKKNIDYMVKKSEVGALELKQSNLKIRLERLKKDLVVLTGLTGEETKTAWCIDLCDRLPGEPDAGDYKNHGEIIPVDTIVGTVDIFDFGTRKYNVNIKAASYTRNPDYNSLNDGISGHTLANDGNGFVYNYNMRGPQATWNPKYRLAIINSITNGIAEITYNVLKDLDGVKFNTMDHLADSAVPVDYMICSASPPFKSGDQVIVSFTGEKMLSPSIIGYYNNPKVCELILPYLLFCPTYNENAGWGEPFYSGDPLVPVNEPFGTTLTSGDTQDKRHKMSAYDSTAGTINTEFGKQNKISSLPVFPGNKTWKGEDGRILSWWGSNGYGSWSHRASEGYETVYNADYPGGLSHPSIAVGDIRHYYNYNNVPFDSDLAIFTSNTGDLSPVKLSSLAATVYLDGVAHTIPSAYLHDLSSWGTYLMGCAMVGDWLIYHESDNTNTGGTQTVYMNAYNLVTLEYRLLNSQVRDYFFSSMPHNHQMPVIYSPNGLKAVTPRFSSDRYFFTNFDIALDGSGDPISGALSNNFANNAFFYYGFKDGVVNNYHVGRTERVKKLYIFDGHSQYDCSIGLVWNPELEGIRSYESLFIAIHDIVYIYDIDANGIIQYQTPIATYPSINYFFFTLQNQDVHNVPTNSSSHFIDGIGLVITLPWFIDLHNYAFYTDHGSAHERMNVLFAIDGTGTDLGGILLDNTVNGNLLTVDPMILL